MKPSLQKLQKFLKLEADRNYDNHAVLGGLERMLGPWESEARVEQVSEGFIQVVISRLHDYQRLSPKSRAEALHGLWRRIEREANIKLPPLPEAFESSPAVSKPPAQPREKTDENAQQEMKDEPSPSPSPVLPEDEILLAEDLSTINVPGSDENVHQQEEITQENKVGEEQEQTLPQKVSAERSPLENLPVASDDLGSDATVVSRRQNVPVRSTAGTRQAPESPSAALNAPLTVLPGVGPAHSRTLSRLGLNTLGDMLYFFPRRYDDYTKLRPINRLFYGDEVTVIGTVQSIVARPIRGKHAQIVEAIINDGTGSLRLNWFNQVWIAKRIRAGMQVVLSGKITQYLGRLVMNSPECELLEEVNLHTNRIVPVYPLTANITQRWLRKMMYQVVNYWGPRVKDPLPETVRREVGLTDLPNALLQAHFPDNTSRLNDARHRLAFDEIFYLQLGVLRQKRTWQGRQARVYGTPDDWLQSCIQALPYPLTGAQLRALSDVRADLGAGQPMNRLLQGDVGSGKTVIAALAIAMLARHGAQSAMLAPTSILAEQHYHSLLDLLCSGENQEGNSQFGLTRDQIRLMIGGTSETEKGEIREKLANGGIKVIVGTHALLEEPVVFADLQLAVVDEQHRFGVDQRAILRSKGDNPHLLVMTATPIPRSLALTIYGDLDLSVIDEMPPGRQVIETHVLYPRERERVYSLIRSQVEKGHQAFIIYPLVEESEKSDTPAAVEESARLQNEIFPKYRIGLLHGRMKPEEKDLMMAQFRDRQVDILVSTSVVEVGVDIPNATVMLVEGAERFGLAQLHQFRGRVGRGPDKAYCILIPETPDAVENERLMAMSETNDGFILAERDLQQRGPGEFLGTRQSGYTDLRLASLTDSNLIEKARKASQGVFQRDPELTQPENHLMAITLRHLWGEDIIKGDIS